MRKSDILRAYIHKMREGEVVSCEDLAAATEGRYTTEQIYNFMHTERVYNLLQDRNIPAPPRTRSRKSLTDQQVEWLYFCTNPLTTKKIHQLCAEFGITVATHSRWLRQPHFKREHDRLVKVNIANSEGELFRRTAAKAILEGDAKSTELLYRMSNKPLPTSLAPSSANGTSVELEAVLKAMQETCTPDQLAAVAAKLITGNVLELESPPSGGV